MRVNIGHYSDKRKRTIRVRVDGYDLWNADHTLACVILPILRKTKEAKQGTPFIDDEDVPEEIRSTNAPPRTQQQIDTGWPDEFLEARWAYALDEMIYAFDQIVNEYEDDYFWADYDEIPLEQATKREKRYGEGKVGRRFNLERMKAREARIQKGTILFGKYFRSLWT